jgi:hypothetical protein
MAVNTCQKTHLGPKIDSSQHSESGGVLGYFLRGLVQKILVLT